MKKWKLKKIKWNTRNMLILATCIFLSCVFILTVAAIGLTESGVQPKEDAISATLVLRTYSYNGVYADEFKVELDSKEGVSNLRELESCVKDITLKEYTDMIVWDAEFTYVKEDGTKEERTYRKTDLSDDVDKFLDKYYKP